tara:strand:+ start:5217 stop:6254 length:1038 start_codon:yes stop_codon:yes gene_type:complete
MRILILVLMMIVSFSLKAQFDIKSIFKFSTFYTAVNGGTSIADESVYSINNILEKEQVITPYDYSMSFGVRKIARFGYENRANTFYDGTETSWSDGANIGKRNGLEYLLEIDYKRQMGEEFLDQHHFIRYVGSWYIIKGEYLEDGFADISYYETTQRFRYKVNKRLSTNLGLVQRLAEPYGYDPLADWMLSNGNLHYTYLAIDQGYNIDVYANEYKDPDGNIVATSSEVWEAVIIPQILADYDDKMRNELDRLMLQSLTFGYDYYYYKKSFWLHTWGSVMPWHYNDGSQFAYHKFNNGQWIDYSGGLIFGYKLSKNLGIFAEGKYNKYWNREWYDFKCGVNYVIF